MIRNRKILRVLALFFTIEMLLSYVQPYVAMALTSGPTAPEATSFEPVDTTDMVNLATGDFVYNMPLLEVPGPSGGYPINLSYHAGIMPNEEASWVGLGWTLNPGAITREVSGHPDDHNAARKADRFFWEGGETQTIEVGATYGIAGTGSVTAGLSFSKDTYQGFGVGSFVTVGITTPLQTGSNVGVGGSVTVGTSPFGGPYMSAGINAGISGAENSAVSLGVGANVSTNFESVNAGVGGGVSVSYDNSGGGNGLRAGSASLVGASISTQKGSSGSVSVGGASQTQNRKSDNISTSSFGITLPIPFVHLGYKYQRYWIDETDISYANGILNLPKELKPKSYFDEHDFDTYSLLDPSVDGGIVDQPNPDKVLGGTLPDFDHFSVNAQGVNGNMKPFLGEAYLDKLNDGNDLINKQLGVNDKPVHFRFIGEFSNRYDYEETDFHFNEPHIAYDFDGERTAGEGNNSYGYNETSNELAGRRHIEYYTNSQIINGSAQINGFIDTNSSGFERANNSQVGGFKITNESGVTYHFALPAYTRSEYQYSENTDFEEHGFSFNERFNNTAYAYTWFLTAVTGPDYVDRNNNGNVDKNDWGYWVEMDYGLWAPNYYWRNPGEGFNEDIDANFQNFSEGYKQVYYLDAIRTKTHQAIFVKEVRNDAKSAINDSWRYHSQSRFEGGYYPRSLRQDHYEYTFDADFDVGWAATRFEEFVAKPTSSLKLNKIILTENKISLNKIEGDEYNVFSEMGPRYNYDNPRLRSQTEYIRNNLREPVLDHHTPQYIFDVEDYAQIKASLTSNIIREIELGTDYSLMPGTPNSYPTNLLFGNNISTNKNFYENRLTGKLTLKSIQTKGKSGVSLIPPTSFEYDKNPAYDKDAYDIWGFYKSDYDENLIEQGDNISRSVTPLSSEDIDSWSLSEVRTNLGSSILINYSSDYYNTIANTVHFPFPVSISRETVNENVKIKLELMFPYDHSKIFLNNSELDLLIGYLNKVIWSCECPGPAPCGYKDFKTQTFSDVKVEEVKSDYIYINSSSLLSLLSSTTCSSSDNLIYLANAGLKYSPEIRGGGLKVDNISIKQSELTRKTNYTYLNGTTSFEPYGIDRYTPVDIYESYFKIYKKALYNNFSELLSNSRELPPPGVIYSKVLVDEEVNGTKLPGYAEYRFQTFEDDMVSLQAEGTDGSFSGGSFFGIGYTEGNYRKVSKKDYTSRVGALKSITYYNSFGSRIAKTINHYLYQENEDYTQKLKNNFNNQGHVQETFAHASLSKVKLANGNEPRHMLGTVTKHERFPLIQTGQTSINYRTGITTTSRNLEFDFFSGAVTKRLSSDSYGNWIVDENAPAFRKYKNMGLAVYGGANMLTQNAGSISKKWVPGEKITGLMDIHKPSTGNHSDWYINDLQGIIETGDIIEFVAGGEKRLIKILEEKSSGTDQHYFQFLNEPTTIDALNNRSGRILRKNVLRASAQTWSNKNKKVGYNDEIINASYRWEVDGFNLIKLLEVPNGSYSAGDKVILKNQISGREYSVIINSWSSTRSAYLVDGPLLLLPNAESWLWQPYVKHRSYSFIGDPSTAMSGNGLMAYSDYVEFDGWAHGQEPSSDQWQKDSEITLYDVHSHALEAKDVNGNFAATKMDSRQEQVFATVANAHYNEFAFCGAEDEPLNGFFGGKVKLEGERVEGIGHTGKFWVLSRSGDPKGFSFTIKKPGSTRYHSSFWSTETGSTIKYQEKINGVWRSVKNVDLMPLKSVQVGDDEEDSWHLIRGNFEISANAQEIKVWSEGNGYTLQDDFRVHPLDATMTSYVYNQWGELSYILDANNIFTHYEYDEMGRLIETYRETFEHDEVQTNKVDYVYNTPKSNFTATLNLSSSYRVGENGNLSLASTFDHPDFRYEWHFDDGRTVSSSNSSITWRPTSSGWKKVFGRVRDTKTGVFYDTEEKSIYINPPCPSSGTFLYDDCKYLNSQFCSYLVVGVYANGNCGTFEGAPSNPDLFCPVSEDCDILIDPSEIDN